MSIDPRDEMGLGTCSAPRGTRRHGLLRAGSDDHGRPMHLPLTLIHGARPGPTLVLCAGQHGDEVVGVEVCLHALATIDPGALAGTIIGVPLLNPHGFQRQRRELTDEGGDLNRLFPGMRTGAAGEQIAYHFFEEVVRRADFVLDCHDGGAQNLLWPHCRIQSEQYGRCAAQTKRLGLAFGTDVLVERPGNAGMLAVEAGRRYAIPVVTVEIGGGGRKEPSWIARGARGIRNVCIVEGMLPGEPALPRQQVVLRELSGLPVSRSGQVRFALPLGAAVQRGQKIADLLDPQGGRLPISSSANGVLFGRRTDGPLAAGESLGTILEFTDSLFDGLRPIQGRLIDNRGRRAGLIGSELLAAAADALRKPAYAPAAE